MTFNIFTDGASKGNPGNAGIGVVIYKDNKCVEEISEFVGDKTNNEAEYTAIIKALEKLDELNGKKANIFSDSQLLVKQLKGEYKLKSSKLALLYDEVQKLLEKLDINFMWVPRDENKVADSLANKAIKKMRRENKISKREETGSVLMERSFFGKINCFKVQLNNEGEVYFHLGLLNEKNSKWDWKKVKMSDIELGEIINILKKDEANTSFYHKFNDSKTQIWCKKSLKFFSIKIDSYSKNLSVGEFEVLKIIIEECVRRKNF
jgi:ribonuclease HI